jgi:hypothetical protein
VPAGRRVRRSVRTQQLTLELDDTRTSTAAIWDVLRPRRGRSWCSRSPAWWLPPTGDRAWIPIDREGAPGRLCRPTRVWPTIPS